ncbi:hypothetical protein BX600DRAFT_220287 [Xylariales sp. PMI_506]|nr:hypothetical protein BX600DRAFT_220287 [Xylariales sp. PMI_506]
MATDHDQSATKRGGGVAVKTKGGFKIMKQRHQGLAFVNSSSVNEKLQTWSGFSKPLPPTMKFVTQKNVAGHKRRKDRASSRVSPDSESPEFNRKTPSRQSPKQQHQAVTSSNSWDQSGLSTPEVASTVSTPSDNPPLEALELDLGAWDFIDSYPPDQFTGSSSRGAMPAARNIPREAPLAPWVLDAFPNGFSEESRLFLYAFRELCPANNYPMNEYFKSSVELSTKHFTSEEAYCRDCIARLIDLVNDLKASTAAPEHFGFHYAKLCSEANQLLNCSEQTMTQQLAGFHAIAMLAILACYLGHRDDWNVHMSGLQQIVEVSGGLHTLEPVCQLVVRKADLTGAFELGIQPRFQSQRFFPPISMSLSSEERNGLYSTIHQTFSGCHPSSGVVDVFLSLASFNRVLQTNPIVSGICSLDPRALTEDYFDLECRILSLPCTMHGRETCYLSATSSHHSICSSEDSVTHSVGMQPEAMISTDSSLDSSLCLTALLFLKTMNVPNIDSLFGLSNALALLSWHLRNILNGLREQAFDDIMGPSLMGMLSMSSGTEPPTFSRHSVRPAVIWMCLSADHLAHSLNISEVRSLEVVTEWSGVYKELLFEVIGPSTTDVDLLPLRDLELCWLFNFGKIMNQPWDVHQRLKRMMSVM